MCVHFVSFLRNWRIYMKKRIAKNDWGLDANSSHNHNLIIEFFLVSMSLLHARYVKVMVGWAVPCHSTQPVIFCGAMLTYYIKKSQNFGYIKRDSHPHLGIPLRVKQFNFFVREKAESLSDFKSLKL